MRFEPKVVQSCDPWDDETNDLQLPGDLAELGRQLQDDAVHLARLHPPWSDDGVDRPPFSPPVARPQRGPGKAGRIARWLGAASVVASLLLIAGITVYQASRGAAPTGSFQAAVEDVGRPGADRPSHQFASTPFASTPFASNSFTRSQAPIDSSRLTFPPTFVVPSSGLAAPLTPQEASMLQTGGPQAEAYLDYMEMTTIRNVKLSL